MDESCLWRLQIKIRLWIRCIGKKIKYLLFYFSLFPHTFFILVRLFTRITIYYNWLHMASMRSYVKAPSDWQPDMQLCKFSFVFAYVVCICIYSHLAEPMSRLAIIMSRVSTSTSFLFYHVKRMKKINFEVKFCWTIYKQTSIQVTDGIICYKNILVKVMS